MSPKKKALALIFLHHHIHDDLKNEYLIGEDPAGLWKSLNDRYDHQKMAILPAAQNEWLNLRVQDYITVFEYNSVIFNTVSRLRLSGEKVSEEQMLKKTLSTFHASNVLLQLAKHRGRAGEAAGQDRPRGQSSSGCRAGASLRPSPGLGELLQECQMGMERLDAAEAKEAERVELLKSLPAKEAMLVEEAGRNAGLAADLDEAQAVVEHFKEEAKEEVTQNGHLSSELDDARIALAR
ncbi:hypothetical protein AAC387_Pa07g1928 [Persea americana]